MIACSFQIRMREKFTMTDMNIEQDLSRSVGIDIVRMALKEVNKTPGYRLRYTNQVAEGYITFDEGKRREIVTLDQ